jgi:hypothetical protein
LYVRLKDQIPKGELEKAKMARKLSLQNAKSGL